MRRSTSPFLLISIFFVSQLSACGTLVEKRYTPALQIATSYNAPYFADPTTDYVYKANITVYGKELTGIYIAKKIDDSTHRVVFTTEFGNKLLDLEIGEHSFKVNSIVDELNKKLLINTLKTDFRVLLRNQYTIRKQLQDPTHVVYQSKDDKTYNYLVLNKRDKELVGIVHASKRKEKFNINYTSSNNTIADKIVIQHSNIKLRIELNYFKN